MPGPQSVFTWIVLELAWPRHNKIWPSWILVPTRASLGSCTVYGYIYIYMAIYTAIYEEGREGGRGGSERRRGGRSGEGRGEKAEGDGEEGRNKYSKIKKLRKSPSSVGGIPRFRCLAHMALIKHQKTVLEMAWGPRYANFINNNLRFR